MSRDQYVRDVGFWLRDLPWSVRRDLLAELRGHLNELPAETDLRERLGPPEKYATELRAAADLERQRGVIAFLHARRPRNIVLTLAALTIIGLAIGGVFWVQSYQPIAFAGDIVTPAGGGSMVFHEGRPFRFGITIENTGHFPVRVLGVPLPDDVPFSAPLMVSPALKNAGGMHGPYTRFRPFDLQPGQVRLLFFKGSLACRVHGATAGIGLLDFPVRYSFLWRTSTAEVPLDRQLSIAFPDGVRCPPPR